MNEQEMAAMKLAAPRIGKILQVNISPGGIPKRPVESALVGPDGLAGDGHAHAMHVKPTRAVLMMDEELIEELVGEGFPLVAGSLGENLTVRGLHSQKLTPGTRVRIEPDGPLLETTEPREPCSVLNQIDRRLKGVTKNRSGMMARVLENGRVFAGQTLRPVAAPLRAGVLIGGKSERMGRPKHLLPTAGGKAVAGHVVDVVRPLGMSVVLLGSVEELPEAVRGMARREDEREGAGPVSGLVSLLRSVEEKCGEAGGWGLLLACDLPRLELGPLRRLWEAVECGLNDDFDAAAFLAEDGRRLHTTCAFYHTRVLPAAVKQLEMERSLQRVLAGVRTLVMQASSEEQAALMDFDTPQDYAALLKT